MLQNVTLLAIVAIHTAANSRPRKFVSRDASTIHRVNVVASHRRARAALRQAQRPHARLPRHAPSIVGLQDQMFIAESGRRPSAVAHANFVHELDNVWLGSRNRPGTVREPSGSLCTAIS